MPRSDWLLGSDRRTAAAEHLYKLAADLVARDGYEALDLDSLANLAHCSRATVYRHAGGKAHIRDVLLTRSAARIVESVREQVESLGGPERVTVAIVTALHEIRTDPLGRLAVASLRGSQTTAWLASSAVLTQFAGELAGVAGDDRSADWIVRVVFALLSWPIEDAGMEHEIVRRFVAPAFSGPARRHDETQ